MDDSRSTSIVVKHLPYILVCFLGPLVNFIGLILGSIEVMYFACTTTYTCTATCKLVVVRRSLEHLLLSYRSAYNFYVIGFLSHAVHHTVHVTHCNSLTGFID